MQGYKTIGVAAAAAVAAVLGWWSGTIPGEQALMGVWGLAIVACLRFGVDLKAGGWLSGYKTYIVGIIGMVTAAGSWWAGQLTTEQLVTAIVMGFLGLFYRKGIAKAATGTP